MNDMLKPPSGANAAFMRRVIELSRESMNTLHGGPFGALVIKGDKIISEGTNCVTLWNDPTAHAEVVAIRRACTVLNTFQLTGDRKSTRLNSSHDQISYAVFCLKKKKQQYKLTECQ